MGYYKDRFTHWGTCGEHNEDVCLARRDRNADDGQFHAKRRVPFERPYFCKAQMIDASGFDWGSTLIPQEWQYKEYKSDNPTWQFYDFQN